MTAIDSRTAQRPSRLRYVGWYLITIGTSHLVFPRQWDRMTAVAYAEPVRPWTIGFGITETAMGVLFLGKKTQRVGIAAVVAQGIFLVLSFVTFRRGSSDAE